MTSYDIDQFAWRHARPFYPLDKIKYRPRQICPGSPVRDSGSQLEASRVSAHEAGKNFKV